MDIRLINRARNVTIVQTKTKGAWASLLGLSLEGLREAHTKQVEFEVDAPFMVALKQEAPPGALVVDEDGSTSYLGIPIIVVPVGE